MSVENSKRLAAEAALDYVTPGATIGVGTGSTVSHFIDLLAENMAGEIKAAVSSSDISTRHLLKRGIPVVDLNEVGQLSIYIDDADEANHALQLIKGGGGALTREKIIAAASDQFICIADHSKLVDTLGEFPLPVEVIPMARNPVAEKLQQLGASPKWREGFITDNGHQILDLHGLEIEDAPALETQINQIAGVVTVGLFARRAANLLILGDDTGVKTIHRQIGSSGGDS